MSLAGVEPIVPLGRRTITIERLHVVIEHLTNREICTSLRAWVCRLKDVLDANTKAPLSQLKSKILRALHHYTEKELTHDDVTLIALEIC